MHTCSFCSRQEDQVGRLIRGPSVAICDTCAAAMHGPEPSAFTRLDDFRCSFCSKDHRTGYQSGDTTICDPCVLLCTDIIEHEQGQNTGTG